jgi:hypothetical protein
MDDLDDLDDLDEDEFIAPTLGVNFVPPWVVYIDEDGH